MVTPVQQHQQHNSMHRSPAQQQQQQPSSPLWHALPGSPGPGCGLSCNADVLACRADWLFYQGRFEDAYQLTSVLLGGDPYATQALTTHLAAALQLGKKNELFLRWEGVGGVSARGVVVCNGLGQHNGGGAVAWVCRRVCLQGFIPAELSQP